MYNPAIHQSDYVLSTREQVSQLQAEYYDYRVSYRDACLDIERKLNQCAIRRINSTDRIQDFRLDRLDKDLREARKNLIGLRRYG